MSTALVLVTTQQDFCSEGNLPVAGADELCERLPTVDRSNYAVTLVVQDWHIQPGEHFLQWTPHCIADTNGAKLHDDVLAMTADPYVILCKKGFFPQNLPPFTATEVETHSRKPVKMVLQEYGVEHIDVGGIDYDYGVVDMAAAAPEHEFTAVVRDDLTVYRDEAQSRTRARDHSVKIT